jgi:hypothetical protein
MRTSPVVLLATAALFALPSAAAAACSWKLVTSPSPGVNNILNGISGSSTSDVWAVGRTKPPSAPGMTLAEHWDGTAWSIVPTPNPYLLNVLFAVADVSPKNAWAVGVGVASSGGNQALILHWNGTAWSQVVAPPLSGRLPSLNHLAAISSKDIWAAGTSTDLSGANPAPLVEHWNGKTWSIVSSPNLGTYGSAFASISATAPNDVWAVGGTLTNPSGSSFVTLTEHWNGKKWSIVSSPNANSGDNLFNATVSIAPNDAWAIGDYYTGSAFNTLTEHWDGTKWSIVKSPNVGTLGDGLFGAAAFSSTSVWAVGAVFTASTQDSTFSIKWNGKKWAYVKSPNLSGGNPDYFNAAAALPGTTTLWAVGANYFPSTGKPDLTLTASNACAAMDLGNLSDDAISAPWQLSQPRGTIRPPHAGP